VVVTMSQPRVTAGPVQRKAPTPDITGVVVTVEPAYPREVGTGWHLLVPILVAAGVTHSLGLLLAAILRTGRSSGAGRRSLKDLRRGPEFLVTEFTVRDDGGALVELEIHGHLATSALLPRDHIRAQVRRQRRRDLPLRAHRVDNFTSGRLHRPPSQTIWMHLGPPLLLQAIIGLTVILLIATALVMRHV
jgi:hypothetical protein